MTHYIGSIWEARAQLADDVVPRGVLGAPASIDHLSTVAGVIAHALDDEKL